MSLPATRADIDWIEQRFADIIPEKYRQLSQRGLPNTLGFRFEDGPCRTRRTTKESSRQIRKKRC